jgi:gamma-glutamyl hercynylcysteine S-oxide synthase
VSPAATGIEEIWAFGAMHPRPEIRRAALDLAATRPDDPEAGRLLAWAVNDADDEVAVTALVAIAARNDLGAVDDVFDAVGRSLAALDGGSSTACDTRRRLALETLVRLLDAHPDPGELRRWLSRTGYDRRQALPEEPPEAGTMVKIIGPGANRPFWIDAHPVTWRDYAEFAAAVERDGPCWDHPGRPVDHHHNPVRHLDPGALDYLAEHPVVGVTWYDAWAFAAWKGKVLPSAAQWELAAGGEFGSRHPWGEAAPTPARAHFAAGGTIDDVLARYGRDSTAPIGSHPAGATPTGVHDLAGNVWEWTRSRALDDHELRPFAGCAPYAETMANWTFFGCIKGGSWASPAADLAVGVRAAKHVLQRGPETGFRCVFEPYSA